MALPKTDEGFRDFLAGLSYQFDGRQAPDEPRRRAFRTGWMRAVRGRRYKDATLRALKWDNLGYRAGLAFGAADDASIDAAFDALARIYQQRPQTHEGTR